MKTYIFVYRALTGDRAFLFYSDTDWTGKYVISNLPDELRPCVPKFKYGEWVDIFAASADIPILPEFFDLPPEFQYALIK